MEVRHYKSAVSCRNRVSWYTSVSRTPLGVKLLEAPDSDQSFPNTVPVAIAVPPSPCRGTKSRRKQEAVATNLAESRRLRRRRNLNRIEIPEDHVTVTDELLGRGGFGDVYIADYNGRNAAAKVKESCLPALSRKGLVAVFQGTIRAKKFRSFCNVDPRKHAIKALVSPCGVRPPSPSLTLTHTLRSNRYHRCCQ